MICDLATMTLKFDLLTGMKNFNPGQVNNCIPVHLGKQLYNKLKRRKTLESSLKELTFDQHISEKADKANSHF